MSRVTIRLDRVDSSLTTWDMGVVKRCMAVKGICGVRSLLLLKEAQNKWMGDGSNSSTGFIGEETLWRGSPARELEPTAAYRLEEDIGGGWRSPRKITGQENLNGPPTLLR
jgi:hypothetical protein